MNHGNVSSLGPLKNRLVPSEPVGIDVGQRPCSDPGLSAQPYKRTPTSVKGKKSLARSFRPKPDLKSSATHQWKFSPVALTTLSAAVIPSVEVSRTPDITFEFAAVENTGSEQDSGSSSATHFLGDRQVNTDSDGQPPFFRVGHEVDGVGMLSDPGSREGSEYEDVGDERMASEEGDGAPPTA